MRHPRWAGTLMACVLVAGVAQAQSSVRVRGTIVAIDGNTMIVKSRDGRDLKPCWPIR